MVVATVRALKLHGGLNEKDTLAGVEDTTAVQDGGCATARLLRCVGLRHTVLATPTCTADAVVS